jgi:hypothetical protein
MPKLFTLSPVGWTRCLHRTAFHKRTSRGGWAQHPPDDGLALARGGHRAQRVGVRAGAHHGSVADAADHLVDQPARGEVAHGVNGHAPHRADLAVVVRRGLGFFHWLGLGVIDLRGSKLNDDDGSISKL